MAEIERYSGNVQAFGSQSQGTERTVFGDTTQSDTLDANITADFLRGWGIVGVNENPTKQDFNGLAFTLSQLIAYLHQRGIPEWNGDQEYFEGSVVTTLAGVYRLLAGGDGSVDPDADDGTNWEKAPTQADINQRTIYVGSVADLETIDNPIDGTVYILTGYHPDTRRGGGALEWDATRPKSAHNGVTTFDPDKQFPQDWTDIASLDSWYAASNSGQGCFVRVLNSSAISFDQAGYTSPYCATAMDAAIQAAFNSDLSVTNERKVYLVERGITTGVQFNLRCKSREKIGIVIRPADTFTGDFLFELSPTAETSNATQRSYMEGVYLFGDNRVNKGLAGYTNHTTFKHVRASYTTEAGIDIGYQWNNYFDDIETSFNSGHGFVLSGTSEEGAANSISVNELKAFENDGFGIVLVRAASVLFNGTTIEGNKLGGAYIGAKSSGVVFNAPYLEKNAELGYTFTDPETLNIKADFIVTGTTPDTGFISRAQPVGSVTINEPFEELSATSSTRDCMVFSVGANALTISDPNTRYDYSPSFPLVGLYGAWADSLPGNINIKAGLSLDQEVKVFGSGLDSTGSAFMRGLPVGGDSSAIYPINLSPKTENLVSVNGGGTYAESTRKNPFGSSSKVYSVVAGDRRGVSLSAADYPDLAGRLLQFSAYVYSPGREVGYYSAISGKTTSGGTHLDAQNKWELLTIIFEMPSSGTANIGIGPSAGSGGGISITNPVVCQVGTLTRSLAASE